MSYSERVFFKKKCSTFLFFAAIFVIVILGLPILNPPSRLQPFSAPLKRVEVLTTPETTPLPDRIEEDGEEERVLISDRLYHYDASKKYKVIPFAVVGSNWSSAASSSLCLATQTSVERMHSLAETLASWTGPISVAIFIPGPDAQIVTRFLQGLQKCIPNGFDRTSFHFVYPVDRPPEENFFKFTEKFECTISPKVYVDDLIASNRPPDVTKWRNTLLYPQNLLRNTAANRCPSEWFLIADVDMITPPSLTKRLQNFSTLRSTQNCTKCAFVIPTYEVKEPEGWAPVWGIDEAMPKTKSGLLNLRKKHMARGFHEIVFRENQEASNLPHWERLPPTKTDDISVAYDITNPPFWYEPVYMTLQGAPQFDERFVGFGMTRNTQAYEMLLAGYKFKILDNAFMIHWGFQEGKDRPAWRVNQTNANYLLFKKWLLEKSVEYDADPYKMIQKTVGDQSKRNVQVTVLKVQHNYTRPKG